MSSYQTGNLVILNTMTGCSGFSFFLGIFMFFFISWVHGFSYRFHALKIPLLPSIIGSQIWMDSQEYFKASLWRGLLLWLRWTRIVFYGCYHIYIYIYISSSSSMDHRISSLLILASCISACNLLPSSDWVHASVSCPYCLLQFIIKSMLPSASLLSSAIYIIGFV